MARFVFGMNVSLDGYVDHTEFGPGPALFQHFVDEVGGQSGCIYGRRMYEVMRYWEDDDPTWGDAERAFAAAWRSQPTWVVSRSLTSVGPTATLVGSDLAAELRAIKSDHEGEIEVAGPHLAASLVELGLVDEFRMYVHPLALGRGTPYFVGSVPRLRLTGHDEIADGVLRLTYIPV